MASIRSSIFLSKITMKIKLRAEDNLAAIRSQIKEMTAPHSRVIELGCGKGDLLLELSSTIDFGLGIDQSKQAIQKAVLQREQRKVSNIDFLCKKLDQSNSPDHTFDTAIASLFFHVIPITDSLDLINKMRETVDTLLIVAFCKAETLQQKSILWIDQRMTSHYRHFNAYKDFGYMEGILAQAQISHFKTYDTSIPFVRIYQIRNRP